MVVNINQLILPMTDKAVLQLQALGFSAYESKAYIALLGLPPSTPYEIAKASGIPSSKIYETLGKLQTRETIQKTSDVADTPTYVALPPNDLLNQLTSQILHQTSELLPLLEAAQNPASPESIWPLAELEDLKRQARDCVQTAQKSILISCWPEELEWLIADLKEAEKRGIKIALVHFGETAQKVGATYHHPVEQTLYAEKGGRGLTLVADSRIVVIANIGERLDASWSRNHAFVTVAEDYVKHDVYITKVTRFLKDEVTERFGENYEQLRNIFDAEA